MANAVRQKIAKHELLLQQSRGLFQPLEEQIGHVLANAVFVLRDQITFFFLLIDGSVRSPLAGGPVDQIPGALLELHPLKGAAFLCRGSWESLVYCMVLSRVRLFFFGLLEISWKIVTDLVDLDGGPFLSQLKAELLWNQRFPCSAKALEAQKKSAPVHYGSQASFF